MSQTSERIAQHEQKARARYLEAIQHGATGPPPGWLADFIEHRALSLLARVGFDRDIAYNLFRISAPAWKSMGPITDPKLRLHPILAGKIKEIRRDILSRNEKKPRHLELPAGETQEDLTNLLRAVPATWIILPRAHSFLTKGDSHCLLIYLQHLDRETNLAFERILARILIEFIGNYSLKFISPSLPREQMTEAIFYGYAKMFWKNLRQPPPGLEDLLIFRNYLSWARAFNKRAASSDPDKETVISDMEEMADHILPGHNPHTPTHRKNRGAAGLSITLRHGSSGINHAVRHFTMPVSQGNESYRVLPRQMSTLCRELRNNFDHETPRTQESIHTFLRRLKAAYSPSVSRSNPYRRRNSGNLTFARGRMAHLIRDFSRSLH